jgi:hypothetical protein
VATAVELAREAIGVDAEVPATTVVVHRLDRAGDYVLVRLGKPGVAGWIAAVDVSGRDVMSWAANPRGQSTVPPPPTTGTAEYVWRPCVASRSPLYPLLRTPSASGDGVRFVDLSGRVYDDLAAGHRA